MGCAAGRERFQRTHRTAQIGDTITYDMYVDGKDLIRRAVMDVATAKTTIEYSKWGEPVTIDAPAADQLIELPAR